MPLSDLSPPMNKTSVCHNEEPTAEFCRDLLLRAGPFFLVCTVVVKNKSRCAANWRGNYLNSVRQTLAVSITFAILFWWWLEVIVTDWQLKNHSKNKQTKKPTQMFEDLVISPDRVQVTVNMRMAWMPSRWGVALFPDRCSLHHPVHVCGLFPLLKQAGSFIAQF